MNLGDVKQLVATGQFHHATARTVGVSMIWIYVRDTRGFRGYSMAGAIEDTPEHHAYFASIGHGVSIGSFGAG